MTTQKSSRIELKLAKIAVGSAVLLGLGAATSLQARPMT